MSNLSLLSYPKYYKTSTTELHLSSNNYLVKMDVGKNGDSRPLLVGPLFWSQFLLFMGINSE
jgi:hypothetical protein